MWGLLVGGCRYEAGSGVERCMLAVGGWRLDVCGEVDGGKVGGWG